MMRFYYAYSIRIATIQKLTILSAVKDMEELKLSNIAGGNVKCHSPFGK